jgi:hypothetical protein
VAPRFEQGTSGYGAYMPEISSPGNRFWGRDVTVAVRCLGHWRLAHGAGGAQGSVKAVRDSDECMLVKCGVVRQGGVSGIGGWRMVQVGQESRADKQSRVQKSSMCCQA